MVLSNRNSKGDLTMFPLTGSLSLAAAGAILALTAASMPARADELAQNLGPVAPREPILTWVGSKRIIAFYQPDNGGCAVHVVVWDPTDVNAESTAGFQATLNPRQMAHIETAENKSLYLQCGDNAERLAIVDNEGVVVTDICPWKNVAEVPLRFTADGLIFSQPEERQRSALGH
jgi:hypothetical protein